MNRLFGVHMTDPAGPQGPAGGPAIGATVTDGTPNCVLFVDGSGNLGQDANFTYSSSLLVPVDAFVQYSSAIVTIGAFNGSAAVSSAAQVQAGAQDGSSFTGYVVQGGEVGIQFYGGGSEHIVGKKADGTFHFSLGGVLGVADWLSSDGTSVTLPSLAGTGTRAVVADANGLLSAP